MQLSPILLPFYAGLRIICLDFIEACINFMRYIRHATFIFYFYLYGQRNMSDYPLVLDDIFISSILTLFCVSCKHIKCMDNILLTLFYCYMLGYKNI